MNNKKSTKRALVSSILSLMLCMTMLIGTTFAWFTDSVTSSGNIIKSGTLDVTMEWADGTKAVPAKDSSDWIDASTGAIFDYALWEPGYTEVRHIKIANEGTLALKYQLNIVANGEVSKLADVIDVYYIDEAVQVADRTALTEDKKIGTLTEVLDNISTTASGNLLKGEDDTITLALKMQESAGNEYQNLSIGSNFSVQLLATQLTSENDSFDKQYDKMATIDDIDELNEALAADYDLIQLGANLNVTEGIVIPAGKTVAIDLAGYTMGQKKGDIADTYSLILNKGTLTIEDSVGVGKISFADTTPYTADINWASSTIRNEGTLTVNGGTIENLSSDTVMDFGYPHAIDTFPGSVTNVNGGIVKSLNYDSIRMFCNSTTVATTVNINGGTIINRVSFQNPGSNTAGYGVLNITGGSFITTGKVNANVRLLNFSSAYSNMKATVSGGTFDKGFKTQDIANSGVKTSDWLTFDGVEPTYSVASSTELDNALALGGKVVLSADITGVDANTAITVAAGKNVTLDLNGHKITATANKNGNQELFLVKGNMTVKNGNLELAAQNNQGWNAMATIFDVTAGGVLNLDGVTTNTAGTDMSFAVHLNNWGEVTLNVVNSTLKSSYIPVRVFNSGYDMNNVTIKNSTLDGKYCFWVHNYIGDLNSAQHSDQAIKDRLNFAIYNNGNTFINTGKAPILYGFGNTLYFDANGNAVQ